jgi:hypothetical protein
MNSRYSILLAIAMMSALAVVHPLTRRLDVVSPPNSRRIELVNESGKKLEVDWVNPDTGATIPLAKDFRNGATTTFDTFTNHTFAIHEPSGATCNTEKEGSCEVQYITVNDNSEQGKTLSTYNRCWLVISLEETDSFIFPSHYFSRNRQERIESQLPRHVHASTRASS